MSRGELWSQIKSGLRLEAINGSWEMDVRKELKNNLSAVHTADLQVIQADLKDTGNISDSTMDSERGAGKEGHLDTGK